MSSVWLEGRPAEDARAGLGVLAHERPLVVVERAGLEQQLDGQRELADVVHERAELDDGRGVGVGAELQRDVARVEGDRRRVLGGLGIEGRERAHERDAGREGGAVDGARRAAAAPGGSEESAHSVWLTRCGAVHEGSRASPPPVYDVPAVNPCETADGRCKHRPSRPTQRLITSRGPTGPNRGPNHGPIRVRP